MYPKYPAKVLLIEGKGAGPNSFRVPLEKKGHQIHVVHTGRSALERLATVPPDVIIVDGISLHSGGTRICHLLHEHVPMIPIIVLRAPGESAEAGDADACLVAPFTYRKLLSRIARLIPAREGEILHVGDLSFNVTHRRLYRNGRGIHLTKKLARLLEAFMRHSGEILNRRYLMREVWQTDYMLDTRTLDTHISWLRQVIEEDPKRPQRLLTVHGVGYMLNPGPKGGEDNEREH